MSTTKQGITSMSTISKRGIVRVAGSNKNYDDIIIIEKGIFSGTSYNGSMFDGTMKFYDGRIFTGKFSDNSPADGVWMIYDKDDSVATYNGEWDECKGVMHGNGKLTTEFFTYEGEFKNGLFHGKGKMVVNSKWQGYYGLYKSYDGYWDCGIIDGYGKSVFLNDFRFEGSWNRGIPIRGKYFTENGFIEGIFEISHIHPDLMFPINGTYKSFCKNCKSAECPNIGSFWYDGKFYKGSTNVDENIIVHKVCGKGRIPYKKGIYEGELQYGLPHGKGECSTEYEDGTIMFESGTWRDGEQYGDDCVFDNGDYRFEGDVKNNIFMNGNFFVKGVLRLTCATTNIGAETSHYIEYGNGYTIQGMCSNQFQIQDVRFDDAIAVAINGDWFECKEWNSFGNFLHSIPKYGIGTIHYKNGDIYRGSVSEISVFVRNGKGTMYYKNGMEETKMWYNNELISEEELCTICCGAKMSVALVPCGHFGLCSSCMNNIWKHDKKCPVCRANITTHIILRKM